jgi:acylphosphatase
MHIAANVLGSGTTGVIHTGYRAWFVETAKSLGLTGTAFNRGFHVEVTADGPPNVVLDLLRLARRGPPRARVLDVVVTEMLP